MLTTEPVPPTISVRKTNGESLRKAFLPCYTPRQKGTLLEVENVQDDFRIAIPQHDVPSNGDSFAIGRRRGKSALKFDGNKDNAAFQARRKRAAKHKLPLKPRRQAISLGEARREVSIVSIPIPPMPVVVILAAILAVLVFICKSCISWNHKEPKNYDGKRFTIFQESPPKWGGLGF